METRTTDVLVVGGGSGGVGAAFQIAQARPECHIIVVEGGDMLGGTSTAGGVNAWEPGVGGPGLHLELYERLRRVPGSIGVGKTTHFYRPDEPYGLSQIDPASPYEMSLRRARTPRDQWRRVHFEPDRMAMTMERLLTGSGRVDVAYRTRFVDVRTSARRLEAVVVRPPSGEPYEIRARLFIDGSGGANLALAAGCETSFGEDPANRYDEPSAPPEASRIVNGVSLVFRTEPVQTPGLDELPATARDPAVVRWVAEHRPATVMNEYPNGDLNLNILPVMEGSEFHALSDEDARRLCFGRVWAHWHRLQREYGFDRYRFKSLFPLVGIRESHRLVGRYVLREQDVRSGLKRQPRSDELIAYADHALDTHGRTNTRGPKLGELDQPYGVPYSCLLPREFDNLIVASRGASFSHIAASSCRLSRTMLALGEAAGVASVLALGAGIDYPDVTAAAIRDALGLPEFEALIATQWGIG